MVAAYWIAIAVGTHLPTQFDVSPKVSDKLKHFVAFAGLTFGLCYVTGNQTLREMSAIGTTARFVIIAIIVIAYAVVDEWSQRYIPGRVPDRWDVVADAAGMFTALMIYVSSRYVALHVWTEVPRRTLDQIRQTLASWRGVDYV